MTTKAFKNEKIEAFKKSFEMLPITADIVLKKLPI